MLKEAAGQIYYRHKMVRFAICQELWPNISKRDAQIRYSG